MVYGDEKGGIMEEERVEPKKLTMTSTKKEMLDAYNALLKQLKEKREAELRPERKIEEKKKKEVVDVAETLSSEGVVKEISNLKLGLGKMLTQISDGLEEEVDKFKKIQQAIEVKEQEIKELYEIDRSAETLAALIETHNQKLEEFESEVAARKEALDQEIETTRAQWEKERKAHDAAVKERDAAEARRRDREKEEYGYSFKREQRLAKDKFEDEKGTLEKEIQLKREQMEKDLAEREKALAESEGELNELRQKAVELPNKVEEAVAKASNDTAERIRVEAKNREELLIKQFDGERNVLSTRIDSLEKTVKEQSEQIAKLSGQLEQAYQKVQDIAVKAIEGSSNLRSLAGLQQLVAEQTAKQSQEK
jgi:hypothetical protein